MSNTATLRRLGGSTVIAIPPAFLESLKCSVGDEVEVSLKAGFITVRPKRKKLSLAQRMDMYKDALAFRTQEEVAEDRQWDRFPSAGREHE